VLGKEPVAPSVIRELPLHQPAEIRR